MEKEIKKELGWAWSYVLAQLKENEREVGSWTWAWEKIGIIKI